MIVETTSEDYASLIRGRAPGTYTLADTPIAPPPVLVMLAGVAETVRCTFAPASWLIVDGNEIVGLCSVTRPPENGIIDIGYGIAPSRQGRGFATGAIADVVSWAVRRAEVSAVTAETGIENFASQKVLERNGFARIGERYDEEDGPLISWLRSTD
ncbi:GNAT family N-acetyltransferase [Sphingopyxis sp.]|uniref:GNAT family N-acetyltransferase n=1 Tax=Sphingopyxis sp. TaxID=1908224 RepID=UPI002ED8F7E8